MWILLLKTYIFVRMTLLFFIPMRVWSPILWFLFCKTKDETERKFINILSSINERIDYLIEGRDL